MRRQLYRGTAFFILALVFLVGSPITASAVFIFQSESAIFEPAADKVQFTIGFNQPPDFTVNSQGRQANSFQYFIVGDSSLPYPAKYDSIIRGEEIHLSADTLRIRNSVPPDSGPITVTGGWGAVRGEVPFSLNGNTLTFSTPLSLISDHSLNGTVAYRLESYEFGSLTRLAESQFSVAPEPATGAVVAMGGMTLFCWYAWRRCLNRKWN